MSPPSTTTVDVDATPALTVVKSATPTTVAAAGDTVTYSFLVTNTGNVTVTDPTITETAFSGTGTAPVASCPTGPLAPGASTACTATYVVTQADVDAGSVTNTATATATPPAGVTPPVSDPSSASVTATPAPALTLVKTADTAGITKAGQTVTYSFLVTNTGNVTVSHLAINEGSFTGKGTVSPASCPQASLAPGASTTCTATYVVTQADLDSVDSITNTATATGTAPGSQTPVVSGPSTATIPVKPVSSLSLVKSASPTGAELVVGTEITYTFVVTNTGTVTVHDVVVKEGEFTGSGKLPAPTCPPGDLKPGAQLQCTTKYTLTQADVDRGTVSNRATATGSTSGNTVPPVSPPSDVLIPSPSSPAVSLVKSADTDKVTRAGQQVTYTFVLTNTGNVTVMNPTINEASFSGKGTLTAPVCPSLDSGLAPGQKVVCHATYTAVAADLTGKDLTNTATATVTVPGGSPVTSDPSTVVVKTVQPNDPGQLAFTGATVGWGTGGLAVALMGLGGLLIAVRRRSSDR